MSEYREEEIALYSDGAEIGREYRFEVDDDRKAEWCLEKIREAENEKEKWRAYYADRLEKICREQDATIERMRGYLQAYFDTVPHKATKTQESYQLPSGKLVWKQQAPEYEKDEALILAWLKANGEEQYVKVKEAVDWAELKKRLEICGEQAAFTETGEIVPGIIVAEREPVFKVEVK